jgi:cobalt-zinc-cadmium efflux system outer membrane protein
MFQTLKKSSTAAVLIFPTAALVFFGIALLAGCARFHPEPLAPEKSAAQIEGRRLDDMGLKRFLEDNSGKKFPTWPKSDWNFSELTLAAFYFHSGLEVARQQWLLAAAGIKTAGTRPNPSVTANPAYDTQIPGNYSPWLVPVTFDLPIETAGKRAKRIAEAKHTAESARWQFVSAAWQVRSDVRTALQDFKTAGRRAEILEEQFAAQNEITRLSQQRFDTGEISRPELTIVQIALNKAQFDLSDAQSKKSDARSRLAGSLGLPLAALDGQNFDFDPSPDPAGLTSVDARNMALRSRADVLSALMDYAATEDDLRLQIAKQFPDLHLGPGYAWNSGNAGDNQWSLGVTLEIPIFDQNQGPIAEAEARRKLSAAKFMELQSQIIGQIDRAVADLRVARDQLQTGKKMFEAEQRQKNSAEAQLKIGAGDSLDMQNAKLELSSAALTQLDNEDRFQSAIGALEDALQSPVEEITKAIEQISNERKSDEK